MLGYHDSPKCATDIWAPQPKTWGDNAIENRAFSPFCLHETENEELIEAIAAGESVVMTDRTTDDLEYIKAELSKRYGLDVEFQVT
jgi:hypothetical protein